MKYDYYLFDFDGTIADTGEGIRRSVAYALQKMGREVPEVLLSGHHANIEKWRREQSERITRERRPDLLEKAAEDGKKD